MKKWLSRRAEFLEKGMCAGHSHGDAELLEPENGELFPQRTNEMHIK